MSTSLKLERHGGFALPGKVLPCASMIHRTDNACWAAHWLAPDDRLPPFYRAHTRLHTPPTRLLRQGRKGQEGLAFFTISHYGGAPSTCAKESRLPIQYYNNMSLSSSSSVSLFGLSCLSYSPSPYLHLSLSLHPSPPLIKDEAD